MDVCISIVIPAYNCRGILRRVLQGLFDQKALDSVMEIFVVDDGSTDGTGEMVRTLIPTSPVPLCYIYKSNGGQCSARNMGIRAARGDVLLFLDADILPELHLVGRHAAFHKAHPEPHMALRGRVEVSPEIDRSRQVCNGGSMDTSFKGSTPDLTRLRWIDFITNNISLKRAFVTEHGLLFDEQLRGNEDVEFGYRAMKAGLQLAYDEEALGYHYHPMDLESHLRRARMYGTSYAIWFRRYPELAEELRALGVAHYYGFFSGSPSLLRRTKDHLRRTLANRTTVPVLTWLGQRLHLWHPNWAFFLYRQAYQYHHQDAFRAQCRKMRPQEWKSGQVETATI